jgi:hypothetical protein
VAIIVQDDDFELMKSALQPFTFGYIQLLTWSFVNYHDEHSRAIHDMYIIDHADLAEFNACLYLKIQYCWALNTEVTLF